MSSPYEIQFAQLLQNNHIQYEREYRFASPRRWRFDFIILPVELQIACEIEGGVWNKGRHTRGQGYIADCEKYNEAVLAGWQVLRYTPDTISQAVADISWLIRQYKIKL